MFKPFNLPDGASQFWKSHVLNDCVFKLDHLNACRHTFEHPCRDETYTLYFTFSHHVFTRAAKKAEEYDLSQLYPFPAEDLRLFDTARFELSHYLPDIIATLPEQFCYHGGYGRYCICKITLRCGAEVHYQVVYRSWKQRGKMRFHVESAYPLEQAPGRVKKVNFWVICHNLLHNKKPPKPPR